MNQPTPEWIEQKKKEFGKLRSIVINGETYVYRMLTRPEYITIINNADPNDKTALEKADDATTEMCVLWPEGFKVNNVGAGLPTQLATLISEFSGFVNPQTIPSEPEEL